MPSSKIMQNRQSTRLLGYDYRHSGAYYVTICVAPGRWKKNAFGRIEGAEFEPNRYGEIINAAWIQIPAHHPTASLDSFVLMPNHLHCIVLLNNDVSNEWQTGQFASPQSGALGTIIGAFKSSVSRDIGKMRGERTRVWQRGFYEHIIRSERSLDAIRKYIAENPLCWGKDELNPVEIVGRGHGRPCPYENRAWRPEIPEVI